MPDDVQLGALRKINTPTIANAIEHLGLRGNREGFTNSSIKCFFPELEPVAGYAVTATIRSANPPSGKAASRKPYWDYVLSLPAPRIVVIQDLDQPSGGAYWGEVNANIHRALGCAAVITDGSVRDLDEVRALGFPFFAAEVCVSHGFARLEDFGKPVQVGGLTVSPGDLIVADKHGAILVPPDKVDQIVAAAGEVEKFERPIINLCKSPDFSTKRLAELLEKDTI